MDYDFMILNNAFLIHRPGFKTAKSNQEHTDKPKVAAQNDFIKKIIIPELKQLYGSRKGCEKWWKTSMEINSFWLWCKNFVALFISYIKPIVYNLARNFYLL